MSNYSGWSDWIWPDEQGPPYRARQLENGEYQYEYLDPTAPRANDPDLVGAFQNLNVEDPHYGAYGSYGAGATTSSGPHLEHDHYSTSPALPPISSKAKGKHVDTGNRPSKKNPQGGKPPSSKHRPRHKPKGPSRQDQHNESQYEREADLDPYGDPFYGVKEDMPVPEEGYHQQESEIEAEAPLEDLGFPPEHSARSEPADLQHDHQDSTAHPPAAEEGYGQSEGRVPQHDAYSSRHSKHSKSSGRRKKGHHHKDYKVTEHEGSHPGEPSPDFQDIIEDAGYGTGDATMFASSSSAVPPPAPYDEVEYDEDEQPTPTRARTPRSSEAEPAGQQYGSEQYGSEQYGSQEYGSQEYGSQEYGSQQQYDSPQHGIQQYGGEQFSQYSSQGGYETGQASTHATVYGSAYASSHDSGYDTPQDSSYQPAHGGYSAVHGSTFHTNVSGVMDINASGFGEQLDNRYQIQHSSKFAPGEVFKALWPEPLGSSKDADTPTEVVEQKDRSGQKIYVGFRRFIVVANDEGHCTCVPILTYEHRACTKKGLKPSKHGIVYAEGQKPLMLKNEPRLGYEPICLQPYYATEKLAKESRVNYSKLVTVEHNIKVFFIGRIAHEDFDIVQSAVNECWDAKLRKAGESSRKSRR